MWPPQDVALTQSWLKALRAVGYKFPPVIPQSAGSVAGTVVPREVAPSRQDMQPLALRQQQPRWAVFISSAPEPTPAIKAIAGLQGWQVLVVAAGNSDSAAVNMRPWSSLPNVTYLPTNQQNALGFGILKLLPGTAAR